MLGNLRSDSFGVRYMSNAILTKGMVTGLVGGLLATIVIDLVVVGVFPLMGTPADISFSIIGDTAAGFFALFGLAIAGGVPLGLVVHYLTGIWLGVIFGAVVSHSDALRVDSVKKGAGLGILYTEVVSLPILATAPIILKMTASDAVQWFGVSFVMHLVYGMVLGIVVRSRTE